MEHTNYVNNIRDRITPYRSNCGYNAMDDVSKYSVSWTNLAGDNIYADMHSVGPYTYAKMLEGQGCTDITIYFYTRNGIEVLPAPKWRPVSY